MREIDFAEFLIAWYLGLLVLLLLSGCRAGGVAGLPAGDVGAAGEVVDVLNPVGEIPMVRAWSGQHALRMGADSGSELPVVLFPEAAGALGSPPRTDAPLQFCSVPVSARPAGVPMARVCCIALTGHAPMDGLVGWPLLKGRAWYLDMARNRHAFAQAVPEAVRASWRQLRLRAAEHAVLEIPGVGACMLDTGAPNAVYLPSEMWQAVMEALPDVPRRCYYGESPAAGGAFVAECADFPVFQLGDWVLRRVTVCESFCPDCPMVILGCDWLRRVELWLDAPHGVAYYRRRDGGGASR